MVKDFFKFFTGLRGMWEQTRNFASNNPAMMTVQSVMNFMEQNAPPEYRDIVQNDLKWQQLKQAQSFDDAKVKALGLAKEFPMFAGKTEAELEEYANNLGNSLGFQIS